jgi:hypothetical protein
MSQATITIPTGGQDPNDFMLNLSKSVSEVFMLVFERRELDLSDDEAFALWNLANLQSQLFDWKK